MKYTSNYIDKVLRSKLFYVCYDIIISLNLNFTHKRLK